MPDIRLLILALPILISACATQLAEPDLERLYARLASKPKYPVIVIPGAFGSRLVDAESGDEVWPGGLWNFITGRQLPRLAVPFTDQYPFGQHDLVPGDVFYDLLGKDFYGELVATLEGPGGYDCVAAAHLRADADCVLLSWDWRLDLPLAAQQLDAVIERLRELHGKPDLKVDIVAHSAGGIVARYYMRFGSENVLDRAITPHLVTQTGAMKIRKTVLIGTPNYGSITALQNSIEGMKIGMSRLAPEIEATMPGLYQLLPHPSRTWMLDINGAPLDIDLYDPSVWQRNQWSVYDPDVRQRIHARFARRDDAERFLADLEVFFTTQLVRAKRLHFALSIELENAPNEYVVFGGDCIATVARCLVEWVGGKLHIRLRPAQIENPLPGIDYEGLMLEPGDGSVTKASLLARNTLDPEEPAQGFFPIDYVVLLCERHTDLPRNITFRNNLLNILLY